ncbi:hypothetical protein HAP94_10000 [Acidithiobacillus ferrivorans]|nr:hypothetical protein [Acidithiobacillus ferrivorans]
MKTMLFVHGDKGGVGKSLYASTVADYILSKAEAVIVVEGDKTICDVGDRFSGVDEARVIKSDLSRPETSEEAIIKLLEHLDGISADGDVHIVVNTPANVSTTIDAQAALILPVVRDMGYEVLVAWMMGGGMSADLLMKSSLCAGADRKIAVVNSHFVDASAWLKSEAHSKWVEEGGLDGTLPKMTSSAILAMQTHTEPLSVLAGSTGGQSIVMRQSIKNWLATAYAESVAPLYDGLM